MPCVLAFSYNVLRSGSGPELFVGNGVRRGVGLTQP